MLKPMIKWVGGKTQLLDKLVPLIPEDSEVYVELFLGGGALLLNQLENNKNIKLFIVNDLNTNLIDTYNCIKYPGSYFLLVEQLKRLEEQFNSSDKKKEYYYERRKEYNYLISSSSKIHNKMDDNASYSISQRVRKSALFMFLNKTCFNGLYRVNKKGEMNSPFNNAKYYHPDFINLDNLHKLFLNKDVHFINKSYSDALEDIEYLLKKEKLDKCFFYLDPPYKAVSKNISEVQYTSEGFGDKEQEELKNFCDLLNERGYKFLESNSDPIDCKFFDNLYSKYKIKRVKATRRINSNGNDRGAINEILIRNY